MAVGTWLKASIANKPATRANRGVLRRETKGGMGFLLRKGAKTNHFPATWDEWPESAGTTPGEEHTSPPNLIQVVEGHSINQLRFQIRFLFSIH